jgi:RNA recognition motif-containing protein
MAQKLFIGSLAYTTTDDGLRAFCGQSGSVLTANVVTDQLSGRSRGFGFVEMASVEEAQKAVTELNGRELDGRRLTVEVAKPKTDGARGNGSGGQRTASSR